jgi:uncharacterized protein (DUF58 family)
MGDTGATVAATHETYTFLSKRNIFLFLIPFCLYAGYSLGNKSLFYLGELLLLVLVASYFYARSLFRNVTVERKHYPRSFEEQELAITLHLENRSRIPHFAVEVTDTIPPAPEYRLTTLLPGRFDSQHRYDLHLRTRCARKRGPYVLGPVRLSAADPLGIFPREKTAETFTDLLIYPQTLELADFPLLDRGVLANVGTETIVTPGRGEEFVQIREYQRGDSPRFIHWGSTARHAKLMVKEFQENVVTEVTLFLDLGRLSLTGLGDVTSVEYLIKAAASVAEAAIEKSHLVQVFAIGKTVEFIPLGGGTQHLINILDRMTFFRAEGEGNFAAQFARLVHVLRPGSTAVLFVSASPFDLDAIRPAIRHLVFERIKVIIVLIDDRSFLKLWKEQEALHARALPLDELTRALWNEGCTVYTIASKERIEQRLGVPAYHEIV